MNLPTFISVLIKVDMGDTLIFLKLKYIIDGTYET
jgi:hypothetical protein